MEVGGLERRFGRWELILGEVGVGLVFGGVLECGGSIVSGLVECRIGGLGVGVWVWICGVEWEFEYVFWVGGELVFVGVWERDGGGVGG